MCLMETLTDRDAFGIALRDEQVGYREQPIFQTMVDLNRPWQKYDIAPQVPVDGDHPQGLRA